MLNTWEVHRSLSVLITQCLGTGCPTVLSCLDHPLLGYNSITTHLHKGFSLFSEWSTCWEISLTLWPCIFTGGSFLCSGHVHVLVGCAAKGEGRWIEVTMTTSVQWKSRHGEKGQGDYEGTNAGFFEDTGYCPHLEETGCFESTGGGWDVGICGKARLKRCRRCFFKWAVSSGFCFQARL